VDCGTDGFACRDPDSKNCDIWLNWDCPDIFNDDDDDPSDDFRPPWDNKPAAVDCGSDQTAYRLIMYDTFGDGWDETTIKITPSAGSDKAVFEGGLKYGSQGTEYVCLGTDPSCYHVEVQGGIWGREVSWDIRGFNEGSPSVASGGAPMDCEFGVAGGKCENTCTGKANKDPTDDPDYKDFKDMYNCIEEKCMIQTAACQDDPKCVECFADEVGA
jgi:hypothetical protein